MRRTARALTGATLTGLLLEGERLHLRLLPDQVVSIDLPSGRLLPEPPRKRLPWLTLPGWLRISGVSCEAQQVRLDISGAVYTWQIQVSQARGIVLHGLAAPAMTPRKL
jgi:hypothetical protein